MRRLLILTTLLLAALTDLSAASRPIAAFKPMCDSLTSYLRQDAYINTKLYVSGASVSGGKLNLIFNSRSDREYRILLIGKVLENCSERLENVYCVGSYPAKVKRYLSRRSKCPVFAVADEKMSEIMINAEENEMFLGIGNIKGSGEALIERLSQGGGCNA